MGDVLQEFTWICAGPGGYVWRDEWRPPAFDLAPFRTAPAPGKGPFLFYSAEAVLRQSRPLKNTPTLFRIFVATPTTKAAALAFAEQYGFLGAPEITKETLAKVRLPHGIDVTIPVTRLHVPPAAPSPVRSDVGELFSGWCGAQAAMRFAVEHWDALRQDVNASGRERVARTEQVCDMINDQLPRVGLGAHLSVNAEGSVTLDYTPDNLLAAMWYQFVNAVLEDKRYPLCRFCGRPFEVSATRTNADFCRASCKTADYRHRRRQAADMHAAGKSLKEIVAAVGRGKEPARSRTVKKWLAS